jgi:hypothetical protein
MIDQRKMENKRRKWIHMGENQVRKGVIEYIKIEYHEKGKIKFCEGVGGYFSNQT